MTNIASHFLSAHSSYTRVDRNTEVNTLI